MIYLVNTSINENSTLEVCEQLDKLNLSYYKPNEVIEFQGRKININAFEQLKKRNPNNPYIIELKKTIMNILIQNIEQNKIVLIINNRNEQFEKETLFEISIAWYLKKQMLSYNDISYLNGELIQAMDIISLKRGIDKIIELTTIKEEIKQIEKEIPKIMESKKHKLTIQE
jgi:hypothetical protein